jgi:hypothetical protein
VLTANSAAAAYQQAVADRSTAQLKGGLRVGDLAVQLDGVFEELCGVPQTNQSLGNLARRADRLKALCERE